MKKNNCALRRYYRETRSYLPVSCKQKNRVIADLRSSVEAYLDANPDADMQEIQAHFGTPNSIAAAYVDNADTADLLRDLRIRKKIVSIVVVGILAIALAVTATLALEFAAFYNSVNGGVTETITNGSTETVP